MINKHLVMQILIVLVAIYAVQTSKGIEVQAAESTGTGQETIMAELRKATEPTVPSAERVKRCIALLEREMSKPSRPEYGIVGGPIDTGYIQEVIIGSVWAQDVRESERINIRHCILSQLKSIDASNKPLRDRLIIMLGCTGDTTTVDELINIVKNHPDGFMRYAAVLALGYLEDHSAIPVLKQALNSDNYARIDISRQIGGIVYSPIRAYAAVALKRMGEKVPENADVIDKKFGVERVQPLLYNNDTARRTIYILTGIGGNESISALQAFITKKRGTNEDSDLVSLAESALSRLQQDKSK